MQIDKMCNVWLKQKVRINIMDRIVWCGEYHIQKVYKYDEGA